MARCLIVCVLLARGGSCGAVLGAPVSHLSISQHAAKGDGSKHVYVPCNLACTALPSLPQCRGCHTRRMQPLPQHAADAVRQRRPHVPQPAGGMLGNRQSPVLPDLPLPLGTPSAPSRSRPHPGASRSRTWRGVPGGGMYCQR